MLRFWCFFCLTETYFAVIYVFCICKLLSTLTNESLRFINPPANKMCISIKFVEKVVWAALSPDSEDLNCGKGDFLLVDNGIVRDQLYQPYANKSMEPDEIYPRSTEGACGCYGSTPLYQPLKVLGVWGSP